jgi:hypothetical protein
MGPGLAGNVRLTEPTARPKSRMAGQTMQLPRIQRGFVAAALAGTLGFGCASDSDE